MKFIFPPRPIGKIDPSQLPDYEKTGKWIAQRKFNGTRNVINVFNGNVEMFERTGKKHSQFVLTKEIKQEILSLKIDKNLDYRFDSEILNAKTSNAAYKQKIVLFDILTYESRYLFGAPKLLERYEILKKICGSPTQHEPNGIALRISEHVWLAENFYDNFTQRYKEFILREEIEGLVLKLKDSVIDNIGLKEYEIAWQIRCRKKSKNYNF